jgi:hypothetical protein
MSFLFIDTAKYIKYSIGLKGALNKCSNFVVYW